MNYRIFTLIVLISISFIYSCDEPPQKTSDKIDKTADGLKDLIDVFSEKSKEVINDKELQDKLKTVLTELETEGQELAKQLEGIIKDNEGDWKAKIDELKNDPKFKEQLKALKTDSKEIQGILDEVTNALKDEKVEQ